MIEIIRNFFDSTGLGPHGMCLVWREDLLALHIFSDALIALSYFTIPFFLFVVAYRRRDLIFRGAFHQFSAFILLCGLTHVFAIWVMWNPDYIEFGLLKLATGLVSATTAFTLWHILPQVLAMPSPAQLREAQKMEALGQLTGGVAHDFNNLLGIVLGNLQLLQDRIKPGDRKRQFVDTAVRATFRGADLTQRLLAFARRQPLNPASADLNHVVTAASELLLRTLQANINVKTEFATDLWHTRIDEVQVETAILNLVLNAQQAMPEGGTLTIETANVTGDEFAALQAGKVSPGEYVMLAVSDTGIGMTPEVLDHAFDPFYTTKPVGEGNGMGLSMVYGLAKQLGGHVRIESEPGNGTTVKLYFPRTDAAPTPRQPPVATGDIGTGSQQRVLLVEDESDLRDVTGRILTELGYRVVEAADGAEALELVKRRPDIDLLLTDVMLPGEMSGIDVAEAVRDVLREEIPVVYVTGYRDRASRSRNVIPPDADILAKSYTRNALGEFVRRALDR